MTNDLLNYIAELNSALASSGDFRSNLRRALELGQGIGFTVSFVLLHDPASDTFDLAGAAGLSLPEFRRLDSRAGRGVFRSIIENGGFTVTDTAADPDLEAIFAGRPPETLILVPIDLNNKTLGVLGAGSADRERADERRQLLDVTASMIAQTLRIEHAVRGERQKLRDENLTLKHELKEKYDFSHIVGTSGAIRQVYEHVSQVARSNATVLLRGESGTGKELIAKAIHYNSLRSKRPLITVNCAALPEALIESELFGHEKGAFTGADRFKKGRFELADGGTLFLDEIGDLPPQTQVKLLRVLQEREFERVGGTETIKTNIRLIAATNKDLEAAMAGGEFREDLYYRLNVFSIFLPPLRERKADILLLAEHFLEKYEAEHGKRVRRISTPAIDMLMSYHFPGNVRELENAIERAVLVCDANVIHGHHLPPSLQTAEVTDTVTDLSLASAVEAFERDMIQDALKSTRGNVAKAARALDSTERILGYKIKKYGIDTMRFRR
jgi:Nif-specific regulatory protein